MLLAKARSTAGESFTDDPTGGEMEEAAAPPFCSSVTFVAINLRSSQREQPAFQSLKQIQPTRGTPRHRKWGQIIGQLLIEVKF